MHVLASKAYGQTQKRTAAVKSIEHALFEQITLALELAAHAGENDLSEWADAVNRNQQLWTAITADVLHPVNALPEETKKHLLSIAEFVRQHSIKIHARTGDIGDLIEINRTIMDGLAAGGQVTPNGDGSLCRV